MAFERVLSPLQVGGVTLPNRIVRTAHGTNIGGGRMSDALIDYHAARARGGVGLSILEILSVHPSSPAPLLAFDPTLVDGYRQLVAACHPHGMKVFQQIWHGGHHALPLDGGPPWSASDVPSVTVGVVPRPMSRAQIAEIVAAFGRAAALCEAGGLDGAELHAAHGYLVQQFLSPLTNRRGDEYGGGFEGRLRFAREVLGAMRAAVRPGFPIGVRLAPEITPGGMTPEDVAGVARALEAEGLVDFVDVSMGGYLAFPKMIGGMHEPSAYELPTSAPVTAAVRVPRLVTGKIRTLEEAERVLASGVADLVGMTRAHIADADLVRKTLAGRAAEVRPCIACNQGCVGELLGPQGRMSCTVNAAVGRERQQADEALPRAARRRRVLVVGGGPAGMEAARVAALRGHEVALYEAEERLGGMLNVARRAPHHADVGLIADWLERELRRLGVALHVKTRVDAAQVRRLAPDALILATGATPRLDGVQAARPGQPPAGVERALSTRALFDAPRAQLGESALVLDDTGAYEAIGAAEYLVEAGLAVTFATRHISFAPRLESALTPEPALERLARGKFSLHTRARLVALGPRDAELQHLYGGATWRVPAETVVLVTANRPERSLLDALDGFAGEIHVAGDASSPRLLPAAIREGHRAGAEV